MLNFRTLLCAGALGLLATGAQAQNTGGTSLIPLLTAPRISAVHQIDPTTVDPTTYISLHGGGMVSPRGGALVGADVSLPSVSIGPGWHGRVSGDVIFKANFGGINDIVPVTLDQIYYAPGSMGSLNGYYGAGLGAILSGPAKFDGKLILGAQINNRIGAELNLHFNEEDTLVTIFARLHL